MDVSSCAELLLVNITQIKACDGSMESRFVELIFVREKYCTVLFLCAMPDVIIDFFHRLVHFSECQCYTKFVLFHNCIGTALIKCCTVPLLHWYIFLSVVLFRYCIGIALSFVSFYYCIGTALKFCAVNIIALV